MSAMEPRPWRLWDHVVHRVTGRVSARILVDREHQMWLDDVQRRMSGRAKARATSHEIPELIIFTDGRWRFLTEKTEGRELVEAANIVRMVREIDPRILAARDEEAER